MRARAVAGPFALVALVAPAAVAAAPPVELTIAVCVAVDGGHPVVDVAWLDAQIAEANRMYGESGMRFRRGAPGRLDPRFAQILTREERDAAAGELEPGAINLRVTGALADVDEPGVVRRGVHWHVRADPARHFIILSKIAAPGVLAHELGHYFGNPHSKVVDNLMCYDRTGGPVFLDGKQRAVIRRTLAGYLERGELQPGGR